MNYIRRQVIKKYIAYLLRKLAVNVLYITFFVLNNQYYGLPSVLVMTFVTKPEVIQTHGNTFVSL